MWGAGGYVRSAVGSPPVSFWGSKAAARASFGVEEGEKRTFILLEEVQDGSEYR